MELEETFLPDGTICAQVVGGKQRVIITEFHAEHIPAEQVVPSSNSRRTSSGWTTKPYTIPHRFVVEQSNGDRGVCFDYQSAVDLAMRHANRNPTAR
jgi:hypothetical protein